MNADGQLMSPGPRAELSGSQQMLGGMLACKHSKAYAAGHGAPTVSEMIQVACKAQQLVAVFPPVQACDCHWRSKQNPACICSRRKTLACKLDAAELLKQNQSRS